MPFSKIARIKFSQTLHEVQFQLIHNENEETTTVHLRFLQNRHSRRGLVHHDDTEVSKAGSKRQLILSKK